MTLPSLLTTYNLQLTTTYNLQLTTYNLQLTTYYLLLSIFNFQLSTKMDFCNSTIFNTGLPSCDVRPGKPVGLIFAPKSVEVAAADEENLLPFFDAASRNADRSKRVYPLVGEFSNESANTEPVIGTLAGSAYSEKLADGVLASNFSFPMTLCKAKAYKGLDGYKGSVFVLTDNGLIIGERTKSGALRGLTVTNLTVSVDAMFGDGQNIKMVKLAVVFGRDGQLVKNVDAIRYDFDANDLTGLVSLTLKKVGALTYQVLTKCGGVNLYGSYSTQLAVGTLWVVRNLNTGSAVTVSTVTKAADKEAFLLTPSGALGATYKLSVSLADVAKLATANIVGFEQAERFVDEVTA